MRTRIHVTSVFVDDQEKALKFYTERLVYIHGVSGDVNVRVVLNQAVLVV